MILGKERRGIRGYSWPSLVRACLACCARVCVSFDLNGKWNPRLPFCCDVFLHRPTDGHIAFKRPKPDRVFYTWPYNMSLPWRGLQPNTIRLQRTRLGACILRSCYGVGQQPLVISQVWTWPVT